MEDSFTAPLVCKGTSYEDVIPDKWAHLEQIITEDDTPVDNIPSSKQQRLLVESLYSSWAGSKKKRKFLIDANIGIFYTPDESPIVPDVFLSLDVTVAKDWWQKKNRSYFTHIFAKVPEVVIEIVSNKEGNEDDSKLQIYAQIQIPHYVIFDPQELLSSERLRIYKLLNNKYVKQHNQWLSKAGLGLKFWEGVYEEQEGIWLRWCNRNGNLILTGAENAKRANKRIGKERKRAAQADKRAEKERERAKQADERAENEREFAEQERKRAKQADERAEKERKRAEKANKRVEYLVTKLRELGVNPNQI